MPMKSKAQARLMYAAAAGKSDKVPQKVAKEFVKESHGQSYKRLPEHKKKYDRTKD